MSHLLFFFPTSLHRARLITGFLFLVLSRHSEPPSARRGRCFHFFFSSLFCTHKNNKAKQSKATARNSPTVPPMTLFHLHYHLSILISFSTDCLSLSINCLCETHKYTLHLRAPALLYLIPFFFASVRLVPQPPTLTSGAFNASAIHYGYRTHPPYNTSFLSSVHQ